MSRAISIMFHMCSIKAMTTLWVLSWQCWKFARGQNRNDRLVVVVRIFNATRHPRHIEAAAIAVMYMYLYSLAFMDHPCTLGAAACHQAPPCPLYTQPRARRVWARRNIGLKIVSTRAGFEPTISRLKVECANHYATQPTMIYLLLFSFFVGNQSVYCC